MVNQAMNIAIYIYDNAEVLDFSGPFEVFSVASRFLEEAEKFNVFLVGESGDTIRARGGFSVNPNFGFHDHPFIDLLVVVGGVHTEELKKPDVIAWISSQAQKADMIASVCTGAFLLAEAGVVSNQKVTTHWEDIADLKRSYPRLNVIENQRWVDEGNIMTSGGISAGIDMSLHLVEKFRGADLASKTAKQMEFDRTI